MHILMISDIMPYPPISGATLRNYNLLRRLADDHEVSVIAFARSAADYDAQAQLQSFCKHVVAVEKHESHAMDNPLSFFSYLLTATPPDLRFYHSDSMVDAIRQLTSEDTFDVVQIENTFMGRYIEQLPPYLQARSFITLHDIMSIKMDRMYRLEATLKRRLRLWLYSAMLKSWEPRYLARFRRCLTMSHVDSDALSSLNGGTRPAVVPNGVDTQIYQTLPQLPDQKPSLLFVGNMNYRPNIDAMLFFCHDVLPLIRNEMPDVELWIVGINPAPEVRRLQGDGVHVTGKVDDLLPYYERATAAIVPLRAGGGTRLKILEAMALGRPVISTHVGVEGIQARHDEHLLIADTADAFAQQTLRVLRDPVFARSLTLRGRELVEEKYDWDVITDALVQVYQDVINEEVAIV